MPKLSSLQKDFKKILLQHSLEDSLKTSSKKEEEPNTFNKTTSQYNQTEHQARLAIYKNNIYQSLSQSLKDLYPSVVNSCGEEFFEALCKVFITRHPPTHRSLLFYGEALPTFLQNFEHTQNYPYLSDLALIDFYRHQSFHAQDQVALTHQEIQNLSIETFSQSKLKFVDSLKMISSQWKVFNLWQISMDSKKDTIKEESLEAEIDIDGKEYILIYRDDQHTQNIKKFHIHTLEINESLYALMIKLQEGSILIDALEECLGEYKHFDMSAAIAFLSSRRLISKIVY